MNFIALWQRNRLWFTLCVLTLIGAFLLEEMHLLRLNIGAVYAGIVFLVLALVPNNLLKWQTARTLPGGNALPYLVRYRRDFGVTSGVLFLIHAFINISNILNYDPTTNLGFFLTNKAIAPGVFAIIIFILLLLTSSQASYKLLGRWWKPLHRLVWLAVPIALTHALLMSLGTAGSISLPATIGFGAILVLVFAEGIALIRQRPIDPARRIHVWLVTLGVLAGIAWWFLVS